jgi:hypothetical protein
MDALNGEVQRLFLASPPGFAALFPTILHHPGGRAPEKVLATWMHIPATDRDRVPHKVFVQTVATAIRQDEIPVVVALFKLGNYPTIFRTTIDPRDEEGTLDLLIGQKLQWSIVFAGDEQIRNIASESDPNFWKAIKEAIKDCPAYTRDTESSG